LKYKNAAINGDVKLTLTVEEQNGVAGPQCRRRTTQCAANEPPRKANGAGRRRRSLNGTTREKEKA